MVDKTRKVIHKTIREYKKSVLQLCKPFFLDDATENGEDEVGIVIMSKIEVNAPNDSAEHVLTIINGKGEQVGTYSTMAKRAFKFCNKICKNINEVNLASNIAELTPNIIREMEVLQNLDVTRSKPKSEQKKEAAFIQQRKRKALNDLFKTLQGLGLSYR